MFVEKTPHPKNPNIKIITGTTLRNKQNVRNTHVKLDRLTHDEIRDLLYTLIDDRHKYKIMYHIDNEGWRDTGKFVNSNDIVTADINFEHGQDSALVGRWANKITAFKCLEIPN